MKNFTIMLSLIILPSSATAKPLFEDNFDSGIMSPDWIPVNGNAWVHSGWLHVQDTAGGDRGSVVVVPDLVSG